MIVKRLVRNIGDKVPPFTTEELEQLQEHLQLAEGQVVRREGETEEGERGREGERARGREGEREMRARVPCCRSALGRGAGQSPSFAVCAPWIARRLPHAGSGCIDEG